VLASGIAICLVGAHGDRRATTWTGATLAMAGMVGLVVVIAEPSSAPATAVALIIAGLVLVGAAVVARRVRSSNPGAGAEMAPGDVPPPLA
jgi:drug/metabolite transporter (DMT)-like permease